MRILPSLLAACASLVPVTAQESPPPVRFVPPKPATQPKAQQPEAKKTDTKPTALRSRLVFGKIVDQNGNPVAGMGMTLGSLKTLVTDLCLTKPLARTDAEGRFEFMLAPPKIEPAPKPAKAADPKAIDKNEKGQAKTGPEADRAAKEVLADVLATALADGTLDDQAADLVADRAALLAATAAKNKVVASGKETEQARRAYMQVCGEGWLALRVKMPTVNYTVVPKWKEPKTDKEKIAQVGLNILARVWGAAAEQPRDGIEIKNLIVRRGVMVTGRVVDDAGKPVAGARLMAKDLMTAGRFRGITSASRRNFVSYATSAEDGTFRLPGLFSTGSRLTVTAKGCFGIQRPVVGTSELQLTLRRSALVEGRIVNHDGKPADAKIEVCFESTSSKQSVTLEKDGVFSFHPAHPNRLRLYVLPQGESAKEHGPTYSKIVTGRQKDLVVTLEKKKKPKPKAKPKKKPRLSRFAQASKIGFAVSVIDGLTGRPLRDFKAGSVWKRENYNAKRGYYEGRISSVGKKSKQPGYIRVPGPKSRSTPKGAVVVQAPGYAIFTKMNLVFDPANLSSIVAAMVPESILGGVVHDKATGKVISKARVYLYQLDERGSTQRSRNTLTDTTGRFVFKNLSEGRYRCRVRHNNRSVNKPPFQLAAEEKRCDLAFSMGAALTIRGVITGVRPGKGWQVQLLRESSMNSMRYNPTYRTSENLVDLKKDGRFEFKGIAAGYYEVCLHIPRPSQPNYAMRIPVEPIRVRKRDMTLEIDASEDLPGRLVGKIGFGGVKLDFARLMVVVAPFVPTSPYYYWGYNNIDITGARCQVDSDGKFAVDVKNGKQRVRVFDLITGVQLFQTEFPIRVKSGREKNIPIELALTEVHVKLKPKTEGGLINATWLNLHVQQPQPEALRMFVFFNNYSGKRATGVSLLGANGEIKLVLPALKTKFEVYTEVSRLARTKHKPNNRVGDAELTPKLGEINKLEIEVEVPQTGFDPVPKESEIKEATPKEPAKKAAKAKKEAGK